MANISWFYESASDRNNSSYVETKPSFARHQDTELKSFDERFENLVTQYKGDYGIDLKKDISAMLSDRSFMEQYKSDLLEPVFEAFREVHPNDPHIESVIDNVNNFWDTKVRSYTESASITGFLPIATLEFPVLVKQFFRSVLKDIIEVETTKTPNISKHIRTTFLVDNNTGAEYEYPKCMFDGTWEKLWDAAKGIKIPETVVPLTGGKLYKFDIIDHAKGTKPLDKLSLQFKIIGIQAAGEEIMLPGNGITVEFSTGGTFVNGNIDVKTSNGTPIEDTISGQVDFQNGTVTVTAANDQVTGVIFSGYLSNEKNMRSISVREKRDILRFTIEDGPRWNMPFSIEEIEDAAALLDINYYNRMVDEIVRTQDMMECQSVIKFLNDEFKRFDGLETNTWKLESTVRTYKVDIDPTSLAPGFAGDPFKYISSVIQFRLKSIIHQISEDTKLEGLSFIIVGNPMACQLISPFVEWKQEQGTTIGGIDVNNSYGFATQMGANVRVVATNLYEAYDAEEDDETSERELVLWIYGYPTSNDRISYRHMKYTSHLMTSQSQTAYQSTAAPNGAYNIVTATARYKTFSVQGIQAKLVIKNSKRVYGTAPKRTEITGAPWAPVN